MFGTTKSFLDYFGLKRLEDLPPLVDLADWESLRVQLDLPEVEQASETEGARVTDLPVLYPEVRDDDQEALEELPADEVASDSDEGDEALPELTPLVDDADSDEDELVVSEWPDPAKSGG